MKDIPNTVVLSGSRCPNCNGLILTVQTLKERESVRAVKDAVTGIPLMVPQDPFEPSEGFVLWPQGGVRPVPPEVPPHIAEDYREAVATLSVSPKASAALSRRCLQTVLQEAGGANQNNLVDQIKTVKPNLPPFIQDYVDAIRNIGNFAAHPAKNIATGEIIDVEPGEAEWNLDILDMLFDFYYVQPAIAQAKRDALNNKLAAAGKKPMQ